MTRSSRRSARLRAWVGRQVAVEDHEVDVAGWKARITRSCEAAAPDQELASGRARCAVLHECRPTSTSAERASSTSSATCPRCRPRPLAPGAHRDEQDRALAVADRAGLDAARELLFEGPDPIAEVDVETRRRQWGRSARCRAPSPSSPGFRAADVCASPGSPSSVDAEATMASRRRTARSVRSSRERGAARRRTWVWMQRKPRRRPRPARSRPQSGISMPWALAHHHVGDGAPPVHEARRPGGASRARAHVSSRASSWVTRRSGEESPAEPLERFGCDWRFRPWVLP